MSKSIKSNSDSFNAFVNGLINQDYKSVVIYENVHGPYDDETLSKLKDDENTFVISIGSSSKYANLQIIDKPMRVRVSSLILEDNFASQYNFWRSSKNLQKWKLGLLHFNNKLIGALHLAWMLSASEIYIVGTRSSTVCPKQFDKKLLIQFITIIGKSDIKIYHTSDLDVFDKIAFVYTVTSFNLDNNEEAEIQISSETSQGELTAKKIFSNKNILFDFDEISSCAIVGNSGILLNKEYGNFIDNHDCVVRMNAAEVNGYEQYVGSRTTFRVVNTTVIKGQPLSYTETEKNWLSTVEGERLIFKYSSIRDILKGVHQAANRNDIYLISHNAHKWIKSFEESNGVKNVSLGLMSILLFNQLVDKINVFGFSFHQDPYDKRHYWERLGKHATTGGHNWTAEKNIVLSMHKKQIITIYM